MFLNLPDLISPCLMEEGEARRFAAEGVLEWSELFPATKFRFEAARVEPTFPIFQTQTCIEFGLHPVRRVQTDIDVALMRIF